MAALTAFARRPYPPPTPPLAFQLAFQKGLEILLSRRFGGNAGDPFHVFNRSLNRSCEAKLRAEQETQWEKLKIE
jgi:hypothetical protein